MNARIRTLSLVALLAALLGLGLVWLNASALDNPTITGTVGVNTDPNATNGTWRLRQMGNPAPAGTSHSQQWAQPQILCMPETTPVAFAGTLDVTNMGNGDVAMLGLLDKGLMAAGSSGYHSGAYFYLLKLNATTLRVAPTDGNLGGEIYQTFVDVAVPADNTLDVSFTIDGTADPATCASGALGASPQGCVRVQAESSPVISDSYGSVKTLNNASPYAHNEFANGAYPGCDDFGTALVGYNLTTTGCTADSDAPTTTLVAAAPNPAFSSQSVTLTATVDDSAGLPGIVAKAEYKVDSGAWTAMTAVDAAFDEVNEAVTASLGTLAGGSYQLCVRGVDNSGNTGAESCTTLQVKVLCTTHCYVDPAGDDANGGASAAEPMKSIQLAVNTVSPGGTVHLAAGTYSGNDNLSSEGWRELLITKPLTMLGAGSATTIVQFREETTGIEIEGNVNGDITFEGITFTKVPANTNAAGFNIRFVEWAAKSFDVVTFKDVVSEYASGRNVMLGSNGTYNTVIVEDSSFTQAGAWGFTISGPANNVTITNSHFDNNGRIDKGHAVGLDFEAAGGTSNVSVSGSTFNNNGTKTTNGSKGINILKLTNATFDDIEAHNNFDGVIIWEWHSTTSGITIKNSDLTGNVRGVTIGSETGKTVNDVTITGNDLSGNSNGVLVYRAAGWGEGAITNLDINRNNLSSNPSAGINAVMPYETHDGTCNWWGAADGPSLAGPGSGSKVTTGVTFSPWLYTSDLSGPCYVGGTITIDKVAAGAGALEFEFEVSWSNSNVKLTDAATPYITAPPLQAGPYSIAEVNLPTGWALDSATCDNTATTPVETANPANLTVADGDAWVCTFTNMPKGTIQIVKSAPGGGSLEFEFDVSWSATNVKLSNGESETSPGLTEGNYTVSEVNIPLYWMLTGSTCLNGNESAPASAIPVENGDQWVCAFNNVYAPSNTCPVGAASNEWTDLLGIGMGSTKAHKMQAKLTIPNNTNLVELYGQLVGKNTGLSKYVRFIQPGKNNYVEVNTITSPPNNINGNFWYGADLPVTAATKSVTGKWWLQTSGAKGHLPRAFVLYPTYRDAANSYVNFWSTYDAAEGEVYWDVAQGWTPVRELRVPIAAPLGATALHVEIALVDNDKDARPVWVTVTAGNVTQTQKPTGPNKGDLLNLLVFDLANVPAGTAEIVVRVYSPAPFAETGVGALGGDSATIVGLTANYRCAPITTIP